MKRLILCCDGTWQSLASDYPTNIVKIAQAVLPVDDEGVHQVLYYNPGVGTTDARDRVGGGAFGWGLDGDIVDAYRFLALNWEADDRIYLFGYSRGAYTVRSLAGMIRSCGLVRREHLRQIPRALEIYRSRETRPGDRESSDFIESYSREASIACLGCFDTVGAMGVPDLIPLLPVDNWINRKYEFHDTRLSNIIRRAFHACAIDEERGPFALTPMRANPEVKGQLKQVWFVGDHACIGGGDVRKTPLSNITLKWMLDAIRKDKELGLGFDFARVSGGMEMDPLADFSNDGGMLGWFGSNIRTIGAKETLHPTVRKRWKALRSYRPKALNAHRKALNG